MAIVFCRFTLPNAPENADRVPWYTVPFAAVNVFDSLNGPHVDDPAATSLVWLSARHSVGFPGFTCWITRRWCAWVPTYARVAVVFAPSCCSTASV